MSVFTASQINRYMLQGEQLFCDDYRCITERVALDIVAGTAQYTLPDNTLNIRGITHLGNALLPMSHRNSRFHFEGMTSQSTPRWYIYNNLGQNVIKFFPTPDTSITANQTNLYEPSQILIQCIVEYYAIPDGISIRLPEYIRRRLLKAFVLKQCFSAEGKGQNIKAAQYWDAKWEYLKDTYGGQIYELITTGRKIMSPGLEITRYMPSTAQLPIGMQGIGVDPGE